MPQALNRYAATSLGQPGVAQAAVSDGSLSRLSAPYGFSALKVVGDARYGQAIAHALTPQRFASFYAGTIGEAQISLEAAEGVVDSPHFRKLFKTLGGKNLVTSNYKRTLSSGFNSRSRFRVPIQGDLLDESKRIGGLFDDFGQVTSAPPHFRGSIYTRVQIGLDDVTRMRSALGFGFDFAIAGAFEAYARWDDPYYTTGQKAGRVLIRGGVNAGGGAVGVALVGLVCTTPAAPMCIAAGFVGGIFGSYIADNIFTEKISTVFVGPRERRLKPLNLN